MLEEFIDFVDSVLPSVDSEAKDKAKAAIAQFKKDGNNFEYLMPQVLTYLSQGDIISEIPFRYFDENGKQFQIVAKGMVISTSCHIDQKKYINIVPVFPVSDLEDNENQLKDLRNNKIFDYMYIPENKIKDYFIDFSRVNTYDKRLILNEISNGKIERICSLSQLGFYFFIVKLTVFLMRKEDDDTMLEREI